MHATFRSAPGSDLAVLTLTRFPDPPPGAHYVLWIRNAQGWRPLDLHEPDREGKALQILEGTGLVEAWPLELRITRETRPTGRPFRTGDGDMAATIPPGSARTPLSRAGGPQHGPEDVLHTLGIESRLVSPGAARL